MLTGQRIIPSFALQGDHAPHRLHFVDFDMDVSVWAGRIGTARESCVTTTQ